MEEELEVLLMCYRLMLKYKLVGDTEKYVGFQG
jgi:hypothetical protein